MFGRKYRDRKYEVILGRQFDDDTDASFTGKGVMYGGSDEEWEVFLRLFREVKEAGFHVEFYELDSRRQII